MPLLTLAALLAGVVVAVLATIITIIIRFATTTTSSSVPVSGSITFPTLFCFIATASFSSSLVLVPAIHMGTAARVARSG